MMIIPDDINWFQRQHELQNCIRHKETNKTRTIISILSCYLEPYVFLSQSWPFVASAARIARVNSRTLHKRLSRTSKEVERNRAQIHEVISWSFIDERHRNERRNYENHRLACLANNRAHYGGRMSLGSSPPSSLQRRLLPPIIPTPSRFSA